MSYSRVNANGNDPSRTLAETERQQRNVYNQVYRPLGRELLGSVRSTELVDIAKDNANSNFDASQARNKRMKTRYGVNDTALDRSRNTYDASFAKGLNYDNSVNTARLEQYERNTGLSQELSNVSQGIAQSSTNALGQAATMQTNRKNTNDNIKAQNSAAKKQMAGQAIGAVAMMAFMM